MKTKGLSQIFKHKSKIDKYSNVIDFISDNNY